MNGPTAPTTSAPLVVPVAPGTAEQLARLAHFRGLEYIETPELDHVACFLIGDVGTGLYRSRTAVAMDLWLELLPDAEQLWRLIADDFDDDDLDPPIDQDDALSTAQAEEARYERARERLVGEIQAAISRGRYSAMASRQTAARERQRLDEAMRRHPAGTQLRSVSPTGGAA